MSQAVKPGERSRLGEFFSFEAGEAGPTILLTLYLLLAIASVIALKAASKGLYLSRFDPHTLPYTYVVIAAVVGIFVSFYIKLSVRLPQNLLVIYTQLFFAANLVLFWWLLRLDLDWTPALIIVWTGVFAVILPTQVWTLANHIFTTRQARRLFPFIGSGGILGAALGGQISAQVSRRVGTENLLLTYVFFLLACAWIVAYVWRTNPHAESSSPAKGKRAERPTNLRESINTIRSSPYLALIASLVILSAILGLLVDYQFTYIVRREIADRDRMTAFFSDFASYTAIASLVLHVLLSSRLMRKFGLNFAIFVLPLSMLLGSVTLLFSAGLVAGILLKGGDCAFRHSIDRSSTELLYVPVPSEVRQQAKSFIDMVAARWADGFGGVLLIPLASLWHLGVQQLAWLNLALVIPWLVVAWRLRREYVRTLRASIERRDISAETLLMELAHSSVSQELTASLASTDERAVETGLGLMQYAQSTAASTQLGSLLVHFSPAIRRKALSIVVAKQVPDCAPQVSVFLFLEDHVESLSQALEYLERYDPGEVYVRQRDLLDAPHAVLRGTVAARMLGRGDLQHEKASEVFHKFVESAKDQVEYRKPAAQLLGLVPGDPHCQADLAGFLDDPDPDVVRAAILSVGRAGWHTLIPRLLDLMADRRFRAEARRALSALGEPALPALSEALLDVQRPPRVRRELPRVFSSMGGAKAAACLAENLERAAPELMGAMLRALSRIRLKHPEISFDPDRVTPLVERELRAYYRYLAALQLGSPAGVKASAAFLRRALSEQLSRKMEIIFRLLGLLYPPKEILDAYYGISSGRRDLRANAQEFLDSVLQNPVRQMLLPIIEGPSAERTAEAGRALFGINFSRYEDALRELLREPDPWLQSVALYAAADQGLRDMDAMIEPLGEIADPLLQETVQLARGRLRGRPPAVSALASPPQTAPGAAWKP